MPKKKKTKVAKLKCPNCGNENKFHSYGEASVDISIEWDSKTKEYTATDTGYYLYANGQFTCSQCGEDVDRQVYESELDFGFSNQVEL